MVYLISQINVAVCSTRWLWHTINIPYNYTSTTFSVVFAVEIWQIDQK